MNHPHVLVADLSEPRLDPQSAHHLVSVLRVRPGERVDLTDGRGGLLTCRVASASLRGSTGLQLEPLGDPTFEQAPLNRVGVAMAIAKGDRCDWAVAKLTEVGVDTVVLVDCERSVVRWDGSKAEVGRRRLERVTRSALAQSRRRWLPELVGPLPVGELVERFGQAYMALPGGQPLSGREGLVVVGPEGGWSDRELGLGWPRVGLGPAVMRTETAAVAAGVLLVALRCGLVAPGRTSDPT